MTGARHARFLLIDLTPATRALFRAFRDAQAATRPAGDAMWAAHSRVQQAKSSVRWAAGRADVTDAQRALWAAELIEREAAFTAATARWEEAVQAAGEAFRAARGPMQAEGYPVQWWHGGVMRVPAGVVSPGAWRRDPAFRRRGPLPTP